MNIMIIGTGYVGLVTGACFAELGNTVFCVDTDEKKIEGLKRAKIPIYEQGLGELVRKNVRAKRLFFSTRLEEHLGKVDVVFIAVGTPPDGNGHADLSAVQRVSEEIGRLMTQPLIVVMKSTVPVGTGEKIKERIRGAQRKKVSFSYASIPEFLREGMAVKTFMEPDRVVIGVEDEKAEKVLRALHKPVVSPERPILITTVRTAEVTKYAANAFLAMKVSFINEIAGLCEKVGADVVDVTRALGYDPRIGNKFLQAGIGYGGSCLPKDLAALLHTGEEVGAPLRILSASRKVNNEQKTILVRMLRQHFPTLAGRRIAVWGLSFKPETNDMREAPSVEIVRELLEEGAEVIVYDPVATKEAKKVLPSQTHFATEQYKALRAADALLIVTEWDAFRAPDFPRIKSLLRHPLILDGRNIYNPAELRRKGFLYRGIGRSLPRVRE